MSVKSTVASTRSKTSCSSRIDDTKSSTAAPPRPRRRAKCPRPSLEGRRGSRRGSARRSARLLERILRPSLADDEPSGHLDRWQGAPRIGREPDAAEDRQVARRDRVALQSHQPIDERGIPAEGLPIPGKSSPSTPPLAPRSPRARGAPAAVLRRPLPAWPTDSPAPRPCGRSTPQQQAQGTFRIGRREQRRECAAVAVAEQGARSDPHESSTARRSSMPRAPASTTTRDRRDPSLVVEQDHAGERGQPADQPLVRGQLPEQLEVRDERVDDDHVDGPVADRLVRDPHAVLGHRVPGLRSVHAGHPRGHREPAQADRGEEPQIDLRRPTSLAQTRYPNPYHDATMGRDVFFITTPIYYANDVRTSATPTPRSRATSSRATGVCAATTSAT